MVVPNATPLTMPLTEPIVATAVLVLVQVPPGVPLPQVIVAPTHKAVGPLIAVGEVNTVMMRVDIQPAPSE